MSEEKSRKRGPKPRREKKSIHGWISLDKPYDMTSTQAVGAIKRILSPKKVGHAGTLDPLATGILPIALGEATKTVPFAMESMKVYRFTVKWGAETTTDDLEGPVTETSDARPSRNSILDKLPGFVGVVSQVPPAFSAIKVDGARAYDLARGGAQVELKSRQVFIDEVNLVEMQSEDEAVFEVVCGKGTYVRSLARDLGRALGCFGHISALRRTAVGCFDESNAISLEKLEELVHKASSAAETSKALLPVATALDDIPAFAVNNQDALQIMRGQAVLVKGAEAPSNSEQAYATTGKSPVAIGDIRNGMFRPKRVFNFAA